MNFTLRIPGRTCVLFPPVVWICEQEGRAWLGLAPGMSQVKGGRKNRIRVTESVVRLCWMTVMDSPSWPRSDGRGHSSSKGREDPARSPGLETSMGGPS